MLNTLSLILWGFAGVALAFLTLMTQTWSVLKITPTHPGRSMGLVVGGAIIRWVISGTLLILALSHSLWAMLIAFGTFLISRTLLVFLWQNTFIQKPFRATHAKD